MRSIRNSVQLIGRLGKDPEVRSLDSGKKVASFSLATTEKYKDKQGKKIEETMWHNIVVWGTLAEIVEKYVIKGQQLAIEGKLTYRQYEKDGEKKYFTEIVANDLVMLSEGRKKNSPDNDVPPPPTEEPEYSAPTETKLDEKKKGGGKKKESLGDDLPY